MTGRLAGLVGMGLGGALMYVLDPDVGRRRRAFVRDKAVRGAHKATGALETAGRDAMNRAKGFAAEARSKVRREEVPSDVLEERVRSKIGRAVSHPGAISVRVSRGTVSLSGPVLADEADDLLKTVWKVKGVEDVENHLTVHRSAEGISSLQGEGNFARMRRWPPALRLVAGAGGGALAVYGLSRRGTLGKVFTGLGFGVATTGIAVPGRRRTPEMARGAA